MKALFRMALASCLFVSAQAFAFGPQLVKKEFKCSSETDYVVYIEVVSGITVSYTVEAFCSVENDVDFDTCYLDEAPMTYTCFEEFNALNELRSGDALQIVNGRN